jgi:hypothetical protein
MKLSPAIVTTCLLKAEPLVGWIERTVIAGWYTNWNPDWEYHITSALISTATEVASCAGETHVSDVLDCNTASVSTSPNLHFAEVDS